MLHLNYQNTSNGSDSADLPTSLDPYINSDFSGLILIVYTPSQHLDHRLMVCNTVGFQLRCQLTSIK